MQVASKTASFLVVVAYVRISRLHGCAGNFWLMIAAVELFSSRHK